MTTQIYMELQTEFYGDLKSENYFYEIAASAKEAKILVEAGFEYVCEIEGEKLFKKIKCESKCMPKLKNICLNSCSSIFTNFLQT